MSENTARLVIPAWVKAELEALPADERDEILSHVNRVAASMGFAGWKMLVAPPYVTRPRLARA